MLECAAIGKILCVYTGRIVSLNMYGHGSRVKGALKLFDWFYILKGIVLGSDHQTKISRKFFSVNLKQLIEYNRKCFQLVHSHIQSSTMSIVAGLPIPCKGNFISLLLHSLTA